MWLITAKTEIELTESCYIEDEEHESERKQKVQGREPRDKGKILGGKRETFEIEGPKHESRVEKIDYQMMKSEKYQDVNKEGNLNEKGKKEKGKYEIPQKQKHNKKEKEEKVTANENYTEGNLENKYPAGTRRPRDVP